MNTIDLMSFKGDGDNYISQNEWTELWKKSAKIDYYPIDDVRAIKPKNEKTSDIRSAILETAKYPEKIHFKHHSFTLRRIF